MSNGSENQKRPSGIRREVVSDAELEEHEEEIIPNSMQDMEND